MAADAYLWSFQPAESMELSGANPLLTRLLKVPGARTLAPHLPIVRRRLLRYQARVTERIVEMPWALREVFRHEGARVLDVGCARNRLPIELAVHGFQVVGIDVQDFPHSHPNFTFLKRDATATGFADASFDIVTCISTIEHIGIGHYGDPRYDAGDRRCAEEMLRVLRPGGTLLLSVPYGITDGRPSWFRTYDQESLSALLDGFTIERESFFVKPPGADHWLPGPEDVAARAFSSPLETRGVALVVARKPEA